MSTRSFVRRRLARCLTLGAVLVSATASAQPDKEDEQALPRLGLDVAEPDVRSAPPATAFGVDPAGSNEYVIDFHGYVLLPMRLGIQERTMPGESESETVVHSPPFIPQDQRRFQYTGVLPEPWIQLNFTYGNSTVAGTIILGAAAATEAEAWYDPVRQLGVNAAYVTLDLSKQVGTTFQLRAGALQNRYGAMGSFDAGRYATPLIARISSVGQTATAAFKLGSATLVLEEGIGSQLGRMPAGLPSAGWNDFSNPDTGASFVGHFHAGLSLSQAFQVGLHYAAALSRDDQNVAGKLSKGSINVVGGDARFRTRYGHLYAGAARTSTSNASAVGGVIQILNARDGEGLTREYLGPNSGGNGGLTTFGFQYDLSVARLMFGDDYNGRNPDVLFSLFGIGTSVDSDDAEYDGVLKLKGGAEITYNMLSWFGLSGRFDHVRLNHDFNRRSFNVLTGRLLFHSNWRSRDEFALQYSRFAYGREVYAARGFPPVDDPSQTPDKDALSLSATFWW